MQIDVVFNQAHLTVIALASRSSDSRLPSVSNNSRLPLQFFTKVNANYGLWTACPSLGSFRSAAAYDGRSWTFQEEVLSRRCLYLTEMQAYYTCPFRRVPFQENGRYMEEVKGHTEGDVDNQTLWPEASTSPWSWQQVFVNYALLLERYSSRVLSCETDIVHAFSGIMGKFEEYCGDQSLFGLPESILDVSLL
jgi:hypothetical protein